MPGLDGVDVLRASRSRNPGGRRVLFTGYNEVPTAAARMDEAKPDVILHKPIGPVEFVRAVRALLPLQGR
jgi:DNA-binding NarL/FixJ family response regulator